ncbi:MAG: hypothetical protein HC880_01260 [Bacteroidia bacterium]|nr:hypothetical protein [Bacteroidia bacterium]
MGVDAYAGALAGVSPYNDALNNPVNMNDPSGEFPAALAGFLAGTGTQMAFKAFENAGIKVAGWIQTAVSFGVGYGLSKATGYYEGEILQQRLDERQKEIAGWNRAAEWENMVDNGTAYEYRQVFNQQGELVEYRQISDAGGKDFHIVHQGLLQDDGSVLHGRTMRYHSNFGPGGNSIADALRRGTGIVGNAILAGVRTAISFSPLGRAAETAISLYQGDYTAAALNVIKLPKIPGRFNSRLRSMTDKQFERYQDNGFVRYKRGRPRGIVGTIKEGGKRFDVMVNYHHVFITQKMQRALRLPNSLVHNKFNVVRLNTIQHAIVDKEAYKFLPAWLKPHVGQFKKYNWFSFPRASK